MRSRIFVGAFLFFAVAGVGTLLARGVPVTCEKACCAEGAGCCAGHAAAGVVMNSSDGCCMNHATQEAAMSAVTRDKQWTLVNFVNPVRVNKAFISGPVLIVHDDQKMQRGEPCTTFYRFDPKGGPKEALVSFHCKPRRTAAAETTTLTTVMTEPGVKQLVEYQIAGDSEAHGIPR